MRWNLRLAAAQRDIWKASELQRMLADAGLVISAGKMSNLWSGQPVTIRLDDLEVICEVLGCEPGDLLIREPGKIRRGRAGTRRYSARPRRRWPGDPAPARRAVRAARVSPALHGQRRPAAPAGVPAAELRPLPGLGHAHRAALQGLPQLRQHPPGGAVRHLRPGPARGCGRVPSVPASRPA